MTSAALSLLVAVAAASQVNYTYRIPAEYNQVVVSNIQRKELDDHRTAYKQLWDKDLITRYDDLPANGKVPDFRIPYSGHDYPDKVGGTLAAMAKYDRAFNGGVSKAYKHEQEDLAYHTTVRKPGKEVVHYGRFGRVISVSNEPAVVPVWYGHCNGWSAASIRHAEPQKNVVRNGITFTPADIKGMLAELYMYSSTQFLGGLDDAINPGTLHIALTNWIGRQQHPIAMETAIGDPVINFPIFAYRTSVRRLSANRLDVRNVISYAVHVPREVDKAPKATRELYFHYSLDLDRNGEIVGGSYYGDSGRVDMLWTPLKPTQGGQEGNESGNPYLSTEEVLSIYRDSVDEEMLKKWVNVDPTDAERALVQKDLPAKPVEPNEAKPENMDPEAAPPITEAASTEVTTTPAAPPATVETTAAAPVTTEVPVAVESAAEVPVVDSSAPVPASPAPGVPAP